MDQQEFREFVIKKAQKYIFEGVEVQEEEKKILKQPEPPKLTKPSFTKKNVNKLPKEPKEPKEPKIPKSVSIDEDAVIKEGILSPDKIKILAEEMKKINKKIDLRNPLISPELFDIIAEDKKIVDEDQSNRWKNLYNYEIPKDESR
jgi:hypothetical protein